MTLEEVMVEVGILASGAGAAKSWLSAECSRCEHDVGLAAMMTRETGEQTEYICECGGVPLVINPTGLEALIASGYNTKLLRGEASRPYLIASSGAVWLRQPGIQPVKIGGD
jgi:hypothetical protein